MLVVGCFAVPAYALLIGAQRVRLLTLRLWLVGRRSYELDQGMVRLQLATYQQRSKIPRTRSSGEIGMSGEGDTVSPADWVVRNVGGGQLRGRLLFLILRVHVAYCT